MADKLVIDDWSSAHWRIAWFLEEDADTGAHLGETVFTKADLKKEKHPESRDHIAASLAAARSAGVELFEGAYCWRSKRDVQQALRECNAAIKADRAVRKGTTKTWPDWAIKAKAAGWKPPKKWQP